MSVQFSERVRAEVIRNGQLAAALGMAVTDCPLDPQGSADERVLARWWVRGFLSQRPPMPGEVSYDSGTEAAGLEAWDPGEHPRDRRGRFRRVLSPADQALAAGVASGVDRVVRQLGGGGGVAVVDLVEFADGTRAVRKRMRREAEPLLGPVEDMLDAEEFAVPVADAVGVVVPRVVRGAANTVYMGAVQAPTAQRAGLLVERWMDTDAGRLMGLLDLLIFNNDRHENNWMVDAGQLVGIDHASAWEVEDPRRPPSVVWPFQEHFLTTSAAGGRTWARNDLSPQDIETLRSRLEALSGEFDQRGRRDWFERTMQRLDVVAAHAAGTKVRLR